MNEIRNLMLVDDDQDDQEVFALALEEIDPHFRCLMVSTGIEALDTLSKAQSLKPEIIFLDLNLPRMNGKECLSEIKKNPQLSGIPVIIYTTSDHRTDESETKNLGASAFITKPASFDELVGILRKYLLNMNYSL